MNNDTYGRREFIKYGLISSLFFLTGCSTSKKKLALRGLPEIFPSEFINALSADWEFSPIEDVELKNFSYNYFLKNKTDLLVLNDGWISDLSINLLKEIKADNIRSKFNVQTRSFLDGLGEGLKKKVLPLAVSPWVILLRNEGSLDLENKDSWEVVLSSSLTNKIIFPNSPYLLFSIAERINLVDNFSKIKTQAKSFDDRNALSWVASGRANAAVLPLSSCVDSLIEDPRLSILLPREGSPLNWIVLASPSKSLADFPTDWFDSLWGANYLTSVISKGFLPTTNLSELRRKNINIPQKYKSILIPEESVWNKCWSLPILSFEKKKDLASNWNNS
tara:strand:+ start:365 stop:1366 length:1002 start_codon:yes stop_codon:yes gene_type:complete